MVKPGSAYELTHRWSFNGSYSDSVGGVDATPEGGQKEECLSFEDSPLGGRMVKMAYAGSGTGAWLNLGTGVLGAEDATVEIWARRNAFRSWSRIFDYGKGGSAFDTLFMSWCVADDSSEAVGLYRSHAARFDVQKTMHPYEDGTLYHIVVTVKKNHDGSSTVAWSRRNVLTGVVEKSHSEGAANWTLADFSDSVFCLGHSVVGNDDANASYDEVRIWNCVLNDDALTLSAQKGPDATEADIAAIAAKNGRSLEIVAGAVLEIASGATLLQPVVKGSGTVSGGTLKVSDKFVVKAGETMLASGTVDLADAEVVLEDPENLSSAFSFIKAPAGRSLEIVGTPAATGLPKGWKLVTGGGAGKIVKSGLYVVVR